MAVGQILYGAVTGRAFAPDVFGGFVAALSLQGIIVVLTTAGVPSFALRVNTLSARAALKLRFIALLGAIVSAALYYLLSGPWLVLLNAESGGPQVLPLTVAQLLAPMASLETALLRRQKGALWDAVSLTASWFVGVVAALCCISLLGEPWSLGVAVPAQAAAQLVIASAARMRFPRAVEGVRTADLLRHSGAVTATGMVSSLLGQSPAWAIGALASGSTLGQFARATTIGSLPLTSVATALVRALAPRWHRLDRAAAHVAEKDVTVVAAFLMWLPASIVGSLGPHIVALWLGPGWELAGALCYVLVPAAAIGGVGLVVQSSAELRGIFAPIRQAQVAGALVLAAGMVAAFLLEDYVVIALSVLLSQLVLTVVLVWRLAAESDRSARGTMVALARQTGLAIAAASGAIVVTVSVRAIWGEAPSSVLILAGVVVNLLVWLLSARGNEALAILKDRGMLPDWVWRALRFR